MTTKIVLLGYMGSGKTIIAKNLSEKLGIYVHDLDDIVEKKENATIESIFLNKGELYFRKLENQLFQEIMRNDENFVLSLGGGTPCYFDNHLLLQSENVISFYLKASIETLSERLFLEKEKRPLISHLNTTEIKEFIAKHLFERSFFYYHASNVIIVDHKSVAEIVDEIMAVLT
jgi:shikimate kinase